MIEAAAGDPMTIGNMRRLGVYNLVASCLNDARRHQGLIDASKYADDVEVSWFCLRVKGGKMRQSGRGR